MAIVFIPTEKAIRGYAWYEDTGRFFLYRELGELYLMDRYEKKVRFFPHLFSLFDWCETQGYGTPKFKQEVCNISGSCDIIAEQSKLKVGVE